MTVLDPSGRPWDVTPKRHITTTAHRVKHGPVLNRTIEQAQLGQSRVYDRVLEHFDRHTALPFQAPAGKPSLCKWITAARRGGQDLSNVPVMLASGAASQARLAWLTKNAFERDKAGTIVDEQEKEDAIRRGETRPAVRRPRASRTVAERAVGCRGSRERRSSGTDRPHRLFQGHRWLGFDVAKVFTIGAPLRRERRLGMVLRDGSQENPPVFRLGARPPSDDHRHLRRRPGWRTPMRQNLHSARRARAGPGEGPSARGPTSDNGRLSEAIR